MYVALFEKMDFLLKEENRIQDILIFSYNLNKDPGWDKLEDPDHDLEFCKGACTEIRFLIPIIEGLKKRKQFKRGNFVFIIRCLRFLNVFLEMFDLYVW